MDYLDFKAVCRHLGPALFKDEWIEGLTAREYWRLERRPGAHISLKSPASSVLPGAVNYFTTAECGADMFVDPALRAVLDRQDEMRWQRSKCDEWLTKRRVKRSDDGGVDRVGFEREFARTFPQVTQILKSKADAGPPPKAPRKGAKEKPDEVLKQQVKQSVNDGMSMLAAVRRHSSASTAEGVDADYRRVKRKLNK